MTRNHLHTSSGGKHLVAGSFVLITTIRSTFTKPGAQEYINSIVALWASWGIDFIKLDAVTPVSDSDNTSIDNRADVAAYSQAIAASGRPMWFTLSWALDQDYLDTWQQYGNARRIDEDVECEGGCEPYLTNWPRVILRAYWPAELARAKTRLYLSV